MGINIKGRGVFMLKKIILLIAVVLSLVIAGCNDEESIEKKRKIHSTQLE